MIQEITEREIQNYVDETENRGKFIFKTQADIFQELIARRERIRSGIGVELLPKIWPVLCENFGGLRSEDLCVVTGDSGKGKTTFALRYMLSLLQQGNPCLLFSLEEGFSNLSKRIAEMVLEKPEKKWSDLEVGLFQELMGSSAPLYIFSPSGPVREDLVLNAMKYAAFKYGTKFVVIDNLSFIQRNSQAGQSDASSIGKFLTRLTGFSESFAIPVILIAHPAKGEDKGYREREIGMDELKGSSDIKQLAHTVISLFPFGEKTVVRFQKIRCSDYAKNRGLCITFTYDHEKSTLTEACYKPQIVEIKLCSKSGAK